MECTRVYCVLQITVSTWRHHQGDIVSMHKTSQSIHRYQLAQSALMYSPLILGADFIFVESELFLRGSPGYGLLPECSSEVQSRQLHCCHENNRHLIRQTIIQIGFNCFPSQLLFEYVLSPPLSQRAVDDSVVCTLIKVPAFISCKTTGMQ